ncbi:MAG: penicillin-binding transpeptidase domain-containing protein [Planctomycetaceae bacterium]
MRNQPFNPHVNGSDTLIDPPAELRFRSLAIVFVVVACIVLCRIAWVKAELHGRYLAALNTTSTEYEIIPARDGRILSESADVFATDVDQYAVQIHYRWLQNPVDDIWLKRQVRSRLSAGERRDVAAVERVQRFLVRQREAMWEQVAEVAGITPGDFSNRQQSIQQKVQRIADSVNHRHSQPDKESVETTNSDGPFLKVAAAIRSALTTTPRRKLQNRIVVREEESYHEIVADVPLKIAAAIREQPHLFPGVRVVAGNRRTYPQRSTAAHLVGARTPPKDGDSRPLPANMATESWTPRSGRFGVERSYDHQLHSVPGLRRIVRNRRMEIVESEIERQPVSGRDIVLTLNTDLQRHAEQLLAEALLDQPARFPAARDKEDTEDQMPQPIPVGGSIVVMDVHTGRLVVAASAPSFNLSLFTSGSPSEWEAINKDQRHPFVSRMTSMALPPGSVIKPVTAIAAIESGHLDPNATFHCQGFLNQPDEHRCLIFRLYGQGHNDLSLKQAIAQSCNVYFFTAAQRMGFTALRQWCDQLGLGRETGIDLPFEHHGHVPGQTTTTADRNRRFERETLGLAIGQSSLTVTPVQMARVMAAIANGGWLVTPHVVSSDGTARTTRDVDDRPRDLTRRKISGLSEATLAHIREGLEAVVQEPYGSGYKTVRLDDVAIAGKTGTAETGPDKPDHAWFAGYVPSDKPLYAFVVVLEHGGSGSRAAGPVARELVRRLIAR